MRLHARWIALDLGATVALSGLLLGCSGDVAAPMPAPDPSQLYWALALDHHAINLSTAAPYDTLQLTAAPRTPTSAMLSAAGTVVYTSSDPSTVQVSPAGLLQAVAAGDGVVIVASFTVGNLTHSDTAVVNVTSDPHPPTLANLSIHPVPPDSAKRGGGYAPYPWPVSATDASGYPVPDLAIACTSSDPTVVIILRACGFLAAFHRGHALITATTTAYGVTKADTLLFTVGFPLGATVVLQPSTTTLGTDTIAAGGVVRWINNTSQPVDITFDDATNVAEDSTCQCGSGNVPPFGGDPNDPGANSRRRRFPVPGTYRMQSTAAHVSGTVVVVLDQ